MIEAALDELETEGLLSDRRFAEAYARNRANRGFGPNRIANELRERGVGDGLIADQIESDEHDWSRLASEVRCKKFKTRPRTFDERARQVRFMEYRGFQREQIRYALEEPVNDEDF
jgi:regulatory protein